MVFLDLALFRWKKLFFVVKKHFSLLKIIFGSLKEIL